MKIIVVMPARNEEWILEKTLKAISLFADHIIVADQNSTDGTLEICRKFKKVIVIRNKNRFHISSVRKQLLDAARNFEGNNVILSFDADEIPTAHIIDNNFLNKLKKLPPGSSLLFQWINLWKSPLKYRQDNSIWANSWKPFGFVDDRKADYNFLNVIDHAPRVPVSTLTNIYKFDFPKVLHYNFVDYNRMLSKQIYYRFTEILQRKNTFLNFLKINLTYFPTKDEYNIMLKDIPLSWIEFYTEKDIDLLNFHKEELYWYDIEVLKWFKQYGINRFKWLDIWDIDWEKKRQIAIKRGTKDLPENGIKDSRPFYIKFYHNYLQFLLSHNSFLYKVYRFLKKL